MDEPTKGTADEVNADDMDALVADLDPGDGADLVVGGRGIIVKNGDPCDGSEFQRA
jgi:hypothetical protein